MLLFSFIYFILFFFYSIPYFFGCITCRFLCICVYIWFNYFPTDSEFMQFTDRSIWKWINLFLCFCFNCFNRGNSLRRFKNGSKWRTKEISIDGKPPTFSSSAAAASRNSANLSTTELSPALLAQANWTFVEKLLKVSVIR